MDNPISIINVMPSNIDEIESFFHKTKRDILSGETDPLKIRIQLKALEILLKMLSTDKEIEDYELEEANKYDKTFNLYNAKFQVKEVGTKYDFSSCNDDEYINLIKDKNSLDKKIKNKEAYLKLLKKEMADTETGNIIYPPSKTSKTKVTVSLK